MIVVTDTSPLNYLILLGHVDVLPRIFGCAIVPPAVVRELQHPDAPQVVSRWVSAAPSWLEVRPVGKLDESLPVELGPGEREAISLAVELQAGILLIDEFAGRREAESRQVAVNGTLAVLLQAGLRGYLDFPEELARLRRTGFRCSPRVAREMLGLYQDALYRRW